MQSQSVIPCRFIAHVSEFASFLAKTNGERMVLVRKDNVCKTRISPTALMG